MSIGDKIKGDLLSISAIIVTILHVFIIVGGVTCWVMFQTQVLGNNPIKMIAGK